MLFSCSGSLELNCNHLQTRVLTNIVQMEAASYCSGYFNSEGNKEKSSGRLLL